MERDPSEANIGYSIPDKDDGWFGDAAERIAVRRLAPMPHLKSRSLATAWPRRCPVNA